MIKLEQIKEIDNTKITLEELQTIEESEFVTELQDCGMSGNYVGYHWYIAVTTDGEEINLYVK